MRGSAFRVSTAVVGLIAAAAVAGCGGSSSSTSSSADFVAQGNAICKKSNAQIAALPQPKSNAELTTYLNQASPIIQSALDQVNGLTPPGDKQKAFDTWVGTITNEADLVAEAQSAAADGNSSQAISLLNKQGTLSKQGNAQAAALGLTQCAKSASDQGSSGSSG